MTQQRAVARAAVQGQVGGLGAGRRCLHGFPHLAKIRSVSKARRASAVAEGFSFRVLQHFLEKTLRCIGSYLGSFLGHNSPVLNRSGTGASGYSSVSGVLHTV